MGELSLKLITEPKEEPVSLKAAKLHVKQEESADDALIARFIKAARMNAEEITGRQFITATWEQRFDCFPSWFELIKPPLLSVVSIKYIDTDGNEATVDDSTYTVDTYRTLGRVVLNSGESWPAVKDVINSVRIQWTAGYGPKATNVPEDIKAAITLTIGHLYEHREDVIVGTSANALPEGAMALLWPHRIVDF